MGDECACEKCQSDSVDKPDATVWPVVKEEAQTEGRGQSQRDLYLVITDGGISLLRQTYEM